jgi:hypothetical protein
MPKSKLADEPPPPPLKPDEARTRAIFIRDNIKIVEKLRDEGASFDTMKEAASEFANNYPHLFIMVSSNDGYDKQTLETMMIMIDKMANTTISQHDASVKVGEHLMKKHISKS